MKNVVRDRPASRVSYRVSVDVSVPLGIARSIHRWICDHVGATGAAGSPVLPRWPRGLSLGSRSSNGAWQSLAIARPLVVVDCATAPRSGELRWLVSGLTAENSVGSRPAPRVLVSSVLRKWALIQ